MSNIFCHIDHRPAGTGVNATFTHTYEDGTDVKSSSYIYDLSNLGDIYPQNINSSTAIIVGAHQNNGNPTFGTYFLGKIRRLHIMRFGRLSNDQPGNLAELMNELSKASMVPTQAVQQVMAFNNQTLSRSFVQYT